MLVEQIALDGGQVKAHRSSCFVGRPSLDRFVDCTMPSYRVFSLFGGDVRRSHGAPFRPRARRIERSHQGDKTLVPARFGNREMECAIPFRPIDVIRHFSGAAHTGLDPRDILIAGLGRRYRRDGRLNRKTHFHDVAGARSCDVPVNSGRCRRRRAAQNGAVATTAPQAAFQLKLRQMEAQGSPADPELLCELPFGRQPVAVLQALPRDIALNSVLHFSSSPSQRGRGAMLQLHPQIRDRILFRAEAYHTSRGHAETLRAASISGHGPWASRARVSNAALELDPSAGLRIVGDPMTGRRASEASCASSTRKLRAR